MHNKSKQIALLLIASTALVAATPAADLDRNGEVSRAEFMAAADAQFAAADADFDGQLNKEELHALHEARRIEKAKHHFAKMDVNGDGAVSEAEMLAAQEVRMEKHEDRREAHRARVMERFDANGDGTLSVTERQEARKALKARHKKKRKDRRNTRPRLDADKDGLVSRAEYVAMSEKLFDHMDADGNGVLTQGEGRKGRRGPPPPSNR